MKFGALVLVQRNRKIDCCLSKVLTIFSLLCLLTSLVSCSAKEEIAIGATSNDSSKELDALFTLQREVKDRLEEEYYVTEASVTIVLEDKEQRADFTVVAVFLTEDIPEEEQVSLREIVKEYVPEVKSENISIMFESGSVG